MQTQTCPLIYQYNLHQYPKSHIKMVEVIVQKLNFSIVCEMDLQSGCRHEYTHVTSMIG